MPGNDTFMPDGNPRSNPYGIRGGVDPLIPRTTRALPSTSRSLLHTLLTANKHNQLIGQGQFLAPTQLLTPPSIMATNTSWYNRGRGVLAEDPLLPIVNLMCGTSPPLEIFSLHTTYGSTEAKSASSTNRPSDPPDTHTTEERYTTVKTGSDRCIWRGDITTFLRTLDENTKFTRMGLNNIHINSPGMSEQAIMEATTQFLVSKTNDAKEIFGQYMANIIDVQIWESLQNRAGRMVANFVKNNSVSYSFLKASEETEKASRMAVSRPTVHEQEIELRKVAEVRTRKRLAYEEHQAADFARDPIELIRSMVIAGRETICHRETVKDQAFMVENPLTGESIPYEANLIVTKDLLATFAAHPETQGKLKQGFMKGDVRMTIAKTSCVEVKRGETVVQMNQYHPSQHVPVSAPPEDRKKLIELVNSVISRDASRIRSSMLDVKGLTTVDKNFGKDADDSKRDGMIKRSNWENAKELADALSVTHPAKITVQYITSKDLKLPDLPEKAFVFSEEELMDQRNVEDGGNSRITPYGQQIKHEMFYVPTYVVKSDKLGREKWDEMLQRSQSNNYKDHVDLYKRVRDTGAITMDDINKRRIQRQDNQNTVDSGSSSKQQNLETNKSDNDPSNKVSDHSSASNSYEGEPNDRQGQATVGSGTDGSDCESTDIWWGDDNDNSDCQGFNPPQVHKSARKVWESVQHGPSELTAGISISHFVEFPRTTIPLETVIFTTAITPETRTLGAEEAAVVLSDPCLYSGVRDAAFANDNLKHVYSLETHLNASHLNSNDPTDSLIRTYCDMMKGYAYNSYNGLQVYNNRAIHNRERLNNSQSPDSFANDRSSEKISDVQDLTTGPFYNIIACFPEQGDVPVHDGNKLIYKFKAPQFLGELGEEWWGVDNLITHAFNLGAKEVGGPLKRLSDLLIHMSDTFEKQTVTSTNREWPYMRNSKTYNSIGFDNWVYMEECMNIVTSIYLNSFPNIATNKTLQSVYNAIFDKDVPWAKYMLATIIMQVVTNRKAKFKMTRSEFQDIHANKVPFKMDIDIRMTRAPVEELFANSPIYVDVDAHGKWSNLLEERNATWKYLNYAKFCVLFNQVMEQTKSKTTQLLAGVLMLNRVSPVVLIDMCKQNIGIPLGIDFYLHVPIPSESITYVPGGSVNMINYGATEFNMAAETGTSDLIMSIETTTMFGRNTNKVVGVTSGCLLPVPDLLNKDVRCGTSRKPRISTSFINLSGFADMADMCTTMFKEDVEYFRVTKQDWVNKTHLQFAYMTMKKHVEEHQEGDLQLSHNNEKQRAYVGILTTLKSYPVSSRPFTGVMRPFDLCRRMGREASPLEKHILFYKNANRTGPINALFATPNSMYNLRYTKKNRILLTNMAKDQTVRYQGRADDSDSFVCSETDEMFIEALDCSTSARRETGSPEDEMYADEEAIRYAHKRVYVPVPSDKREFPKLDKNNSTFARDGVALRMTAYTSEDALLKARAQATSGQTNELVVTDARNGYAVLSPYTQVVSRGHYSIRHRNTSDEHISPPFAPSPVRHI